jgi:hypothetical protein
MKFLKALRPFLILWITLPTAQVACCASAGLSNCNNPQPAPLTQTPIVNASRLNAEGPWLLMETDQGLWAANPDGSGMTQLTDVDYWNGSLQDAIQPMGNRVVFISPGNYDFHNMALNLLSLPEGHVTKITELTSAQSEAYAGSGPGEPGFEALRAVGEQPSYAWSPDGTRLAFAGVMDGPSAEIYLYDAVSGNVRRVSQDDAQDFSPSWSPDGNHLLYLGADGFGTGAGMVMAGVWSADSEGNNATLLYQSNSSGEEIVGWLDNTTTVLDSWSPVCGSAQLRLYDVVSKQQIMLNKDCFISAAVNSRRGEALFANSSGLFLLTADNLKSILVSQDSVTGIDPWRSYNDNFTVRFENGGIATFGSSDMDHQVSPVQVPSENLDVATYGAIWGWTSQDDSQSGVWISGPGVEIGQIFTDKARLPIWDPHNNLLFFVPTGGSEYSIYRTTFDSHYQDLSAVASVNGQVQAVTWLGVH